MAKHIKSMESPYNAGALSAFPAFPIVNSATMYKGAFVRLEAGGVNVINAASDDIGFICRGFIQPKKTGMEPLENVPSSNFTGTLTKTAGSENYAAAADNQTVDYVYAVCEPVLPGAIYRVQLDDTRATTTGSDKVGYQLSTTNGRQIDESTAHATTAQQLLSVSIPEAEVDVVDVIVRECQMAGVTA